jgi:hypothetical protein
MAYERCTPMRDARLWDGLCEMRAYEMAVYEMAAYEMAACERHAYEMPPMRDTPMRWSMGDARL